MLDGKLRELRFYLAGRETRITYWIAPGRRVILLTVFTKSRQQERRQIQRAKRALQRCITEQHTMEENNDRTLEMEGREGTPLGGGAGGPITTRPASASSES